MSNAKKKTPEKQDHTLDRLREQAEETGDDDLARRIAMRPRAIYRRLVSWIDDLRELRHATRHSRSP